MDALSPKEQTILNRILDLLGEFTLTEVVCDSPKFMAIPLRSEVFKSWDSLDNVEFIMMLEDEFDVALTDEEIENWNVMGDVVMSINRHLAQK